MLTNEGAASKCPPPPDFCSQAVSPWEALTRAAAGEPEGPRGEGAGGEGGGHRQSTGTQMAMLPFAHFLGFSCF